MKQLTLAATRGFEKHSRATRKAEFLARMEALVPWGEFCTLIEPHYPKAGTPAGGFYVRPTLVAQVPAGHRIAQLADAGGDMADVLVEQSVDLAAILRGRFPQCDEGTDLVERHVQVAALPDEGEPLGVRR